MRETVRDQSYFLTSLEQKEKPRRLSWLSLPASLLMHGFILVAVVLVPILWPGEPPPDRPDIVRVLVYNPPPPPPPPLPLGNSTGTRQEKRSDSAAESVEPVPMTLLDSAFPAPKSLAREVGAEIEQFGSPTGSVFGSPDGMEEGVVGGVVGGVPGGVLGGVIGGTGDGIVGDYDREPRIIRKTEPAYPKDAFVKKIEGEVVLEIVIDSRGRVSRARVVSSIPALDAAAKECVMQWIFAPAFKNGQPVTSLAIAPIGFTIH